MAPKAIYREVIVRVTMWLQLYLFRVCFDFEILCNQLQIENFQFANGVYYKQYKPCLEKYKYHNRDWQKGFYLRNEFFRVIWCWKIFFRSAIADITEIFFLYFIGGPKPYVLTRYKKVCLFRVFAMLSRKVTFILQLSFHTNCEYIRNQKVNCKLSGDMLYCANKYMRIHTYTHLFFCTNLFHKNWSYCRKLSKHWFTIMSLLEPLFF